MSTRLQIKRKLWVVKRKKRNSVNKEENEKKMGQNYSSDRTLKEIAYINRFRFYYIESAGANAL
jgi:hypothetical protein